MILKHSLLTTLLTILLGIPCFSVRAGEHDHHATVAPAQVTADDKPKETYTSAIRTIEGLTLEIDNAIKAEKLDTLKHHGAAIKKAAQTLPELASQSGSGVKEENLRKIGSASYSLGRTGDEFDQAVGAGEIAKVKELYVDLHLLIDDLKKCIAAASNCDSGACGMGNSHSHSGGGGGHCH